MCFCAQIWWSIIETSCCVLLKFMELRGAVLRKVAWCFYALNRRLVLSLGFILYCCIVGAFTYRSFLASGNLAGCSNRRNYWLDWNLMHEMISCDLQNLINAKRMLVIRLMFWPMKWSWCTVMLWLNLLTPFLWSLCGIQGLSSEASHSI